MHAALKALVARSSNSRIAVVSNTKTVAGRFFLTALSLFLPCTVAAQQPETAEAESAADSFSAAQNFAEVLTTAGRVIRGETTMVETQLTVRSATGTTVDVTPANTVNAIFTNRSEQVLARHEVWLSPDDRLRGEVQAISDDELILRGSFGQSFSLPLELVSAVIFRNDLQTPVLSQLRRTVATRRAKTDIVWLQNGDRVRGEFLEMSARRIELEVDSAPLSLARNSCAGIGFNPTLLDDARLPVTWQRLSLTDGSLITITSTLTQDQEGVRVLLGKTLFGATIRVPFKHVAALRFRSAKKVSLSSRLSKATTRYQPFLPGSPRRRDPVVFKDRNVVGRRLRIHNRTFPEGFGVRTRTSVSFELEQPCVRCLAGYGIDDTAHGKGSATVRIAVDRREVFVSEPFTGSSALTRCPPIDLSGVKTLTLTADYASRGDILDHVNWCDPVLIFE